MQYGGAANKADAVAEAALALLLVAALVFGGGSRGTGDLVVHLAAAPAFALAVMRWRWTRATRLQQWFAGALIGAIALAGLQLLPLPAAWFAELPQRAGVLADLHAAGLAPEWLPMTLDRWGTVRALLAIATCAAAWALACTLPAQSRARLIKLVLGLAFLMALLGFAQAAAGTHSQLRPYDYHHPIGAIGSFANRNHFADLVAMLIPFALASGADAQRRRATPIAVAGYGLAVVLLLAASLSYSRSGMALGCVSVAGGLWVLRPTRGTNHTWAGRHYLPLLAVGVAVMAVGYYAWDGIVRRLEQDPLQDLRWQYLAHGLDLVQAYLPWGSGLGSFRDTYAPFEPVASMVHVHALHAHDDLLQIAAEAGIPGLLLVVVLLGVVVVAAWGTLVHGRRLSEDRQGGSLLPKAAAVAVWVPLAHSLVDYPLRTLAIAVVFGLVLAVLLSSGRPAPETRGPAGPRAGRGDEHAVRGADQEQRPYPRRDRQQVRRAVHHAAAHLRHRDHRAGRARRLLAALRRGRTRP